MEHLSHPSHRNEDVKITVLNPQDHLKVRDLERDWLWPREKNIYKMWGCVRCPSAIVMTFFEAQDHCRDEYEFTFVLCSGGVLTCIGRHSIENVQIWDDINFHVDYEGNANDPPELMLYPEDLFSTQILR